VTGLSTPPSTLDSGIFICTPLLSRAGAAATQSPAAAASGRRRPADVGWLPGDAGGVPSRRAVGDTLPTAYVTGVARLPDAESDDDAVEVEGGEVWEGDDGDYGEEEEDEAVGDGEIGDEGNDVNDAEEGDGEVEEPAEAGEAPYLPFPQRRVVYSCDACGKEQVCTMPVGDNCLHLHRCTPMPPV
jgi:hypothetical protein